MSVTSTLESIEKKVSGKKVSGIEFSANIENCMEKIEGKEIFSDQIKEMLELGFNSDSLTDKNEKNITLEEFLSPKNIKENIEKFYNNLNLKDENVKSSIQGIINGGKGNVSNLLNNTINKESGKELFNNLSLSGEGEGKDKIKNIGFEIIKALILGKGDLKAAANLFLKNINDNYKKENGFESIEKCKLFGQEPDDNNPMNNLLPKLLGKATDIFKDLVGNISPTSKFGKVLEVFKGMDNLDDKNTTEINNFFDKLSDIGGSEKGINGVSEIGGNALDFAKSMTGGVPGVSVISPIVNSLMKFLQGITEKLTGGENNGVNHNSIKNPSMPNKPNGIKQ